MITIMGGDPGFASFGYAIAQIDGTGQVKPLIVRGVPVMRLISTDKSNKKLEVYAGDDNVRRCREIYIGLCEVFEAFKPKAFVVERMSYPRSAPVSHKMGLAWGAVVAATTNGNIPIVQISPQAVKKALTGSRSASKDAIQQTLHAQYGIDPGLFTAAVREHVFDALGVVVAAYESSELLRLLKNRAMEEADGSTREAFSTSEPQDHENPPTVYRKKRGRV